MSKRASIEIFGLISVIGSLIFVGVEISQNTQAVRGATHQAISDQASELYLELASDERLSRLAYQMLIKNIKRNELNTTDQMSLDFIQLMGFRRVENIYLQYKNGILTKDALDRIGMDSYRKTFSRESWEMFKTGFDPHFIIFFEKFRDK